MQNEILALARPDILAMSAYRSARSEAVKGNVWLDANENPWNNGLYNRYPEPQPYSLVTSLAKVYNVNSDQILVTRGSDEGIDLLLRLFCRAGQDKIMVCPPTYGMYKVAATIQGATVAEAPLLKEQNFALNLSDILEAWQPSIKLVFLCSPNNPTGNLLVAQDILSLCKKLDKKSIIIVDEAYIEFSNSDSLVKYLNDFPNLVVLRTLSKAYGLAGIRCGATVANPGIIQLLKKIIAPYPIPKPIVEIALKQLSLNAIEDQIKTIQEERNRLFSFLSNLSFVKKVWKSDANFLLFEVSNSRIVTESCANKGIVLRDRSREHNLNNCIRVTIGDPDENTLLMEALSHV
jgi:histidinol-phosphate aminotransferase